MIFQRFFFFLFFCLFDMVIKAENCFLINWIFQKAFATNNTLNWNNFVPNIFLRNMFSYNSSKIDCLKELLPHRWGMSSNRVWVNSSLAHKYLANHKKPILLRQAYFIPAINLYALYFHKKIAQSWVDYHIFENSCFSQN